MVAHAKNTRTPETSYPRLAPWLAFARRERFTKRFMATYESILQETGRFEVVDARERSGTVLEYTECLYRVSISKRYPVIRGAVSYRLQDGTPLRRSKKGFFDTLDGMHRFFVVQGVEMPASAC